MRRMSNAMSVVYLAVVLINSYVLWFSNMPFLFRIAIVALSFVLLVLISVALYAVENIGKHMNSQ